jgi:hypothetical protein
MGIDEIRMKHWIVMKGPSNISSILYDICTLALVVFMQLKP